MYVRCQVIMEEPKEMSFSTLGSVKTNKKKVKRRKAIRITLKLPESNESSCPEYNYGELVSQYMLQQKKKNSPSVGGEVLGRPTLHPNDPRADQSEDDDALQALARQLEKKYGTGNYATGKRKKRKKESDFNALGEGYDDNDSFIDNTGAYDEVLPTHMETKHGGFYINSGELDYTELSDSGEENTILTTPATGKRKSRISSDEEAEQGSGAPTQARMEESDGHSNVSTAEGKRLDEGELLRKRRKLISKMNAKKSSQQGPEAQPVTSAPAESMNSVAASIEAVVNKVRSEVSSKQPSAPSAPASATLAVAAASPAPAPPDTSAPASAPADPAPAAGSAAASDDDSNSSSSSGSSSSDDSSDSSNSSSSSNNENENENNNSSSDDEEDEAKSNGVADPAVPAVQETASDAAVVEGGDVAAAPTVAVAGGGGGRSEEKAVQLPDNLAPELLAVIEELKAEGRMATNCRSSQKFFTDRVKQMVLSIERLLVERGGRNKTQVYHHLSQHVPCGPQTLVKRAKQMLHNFKEAKSTEPLHRLKETLEREMPTVVEAFADNCKKIAELQSSDPPPGITLDEKNKAKMPKKRYTFSSESNALLHSAVAACVAAWDPAGRTETPEEYVSQFLEREVRTLWPKGWVTTRQLYRQCAPAHASITSSGDAGKVGPKKVAGQSTAAVGIGGSKQPSAANTVTKVVAQSGATTQPVKPAAAAQLAAPEPQMSMARPETSVAAATQPVKPAAAARSAGSESQLPTTSVVAAANAAITQPAKPAPSARPVAAVPQLSPSQPAISVAAATSAAVTQAHDTVSLQHNNTEHQARTEKIQQKAQVSKQKLSQSEPSLAKPHHDVHSSKPPPTPVSPSAKQQETSHALPFDARRSVESSPKTVPSQPHAQPVQAHSIDVHHSKLPKDLQIEPIPQHDVQQLKKHITEQLLPSLRPELTISYKAVNTDTSVLLTPTKMQEMVKNVPSSQQSSSSSRSSPSEAKPRPHVDSAASAVEVNIRPNNDYRSTTNVEVCKKTSPISVKSVSSINKMDDSKGSEKQLGQVKSASKFTESKVPVKSTNKAPVSPHGDEQIIELSSDDEKPPPPAACSTPVAVSAVSSASIPTPPQEKRTTPERTPSKLQEEMEDVMKELMEISKQRQQNSPTATAVSSSSSDEKSSGIAAQEPATQRGSGGAAAAHSDRGPSKPAVNNGTHQSKHDKPHLPAELHVPPKKKISSAAGLQQEQMALQQLQQQPQTIKVKHQSQLQDKYQEKYSHEQKLMLQQKKVHQSSGKYASDGDNTAHGSASKQQASLQYNALPLTTATSSSSYSKGSHTVPPPRVSPSQPHYAVNSTKASHSTPSSMQESPQVHSMSSPHNMSNSHHSSGSSHHSSSSMRHAGLASVSSHSTPRHSGGSHQKSSSYSHNTSSGKHSSGNSQYSPNSSHRSSCSSSGGGKHPFSIATLATSSVKSTASTSSDSKQSAHISSLHGELSSPPHRVSSSAFLHGTPSPMGSNSSISYKSSSSHSKHDHSSRSGSSSSSHSHSSYKQHRKTPSSPAEKDSPFGMLTVQQQRDLILKEHQFQEQQQQWMQQQKHKAAASRHSTSSSKW